MIYNLDTGQSECLRYGEKWRDLCGDKMVMAMFDRIVELEEEVLRLPNATSRPVDAARAESEQLFYLQDSRSYVGNDVMWWAKDGRGYTTDLSKAHVYTKDKAISQHNARETDIPWTKGYIDAKTRPAVDAQYIKRDEALEGTGIVLQLRQRPFPRP